jgi:expansin (peptidoglycan-binding protein)
MHVCLLMDDVHAPIDAEPTIGLDGNWQVWTHGPDGNRIELMQISEGSPRWWAAHSDGEHET